jgi:glycosyltransferase involved in cell wall biosynthesis
VWLRTFHSLYNPLLAAKVLAELVPSFPDAQLLMLGPAKDESVLQRFNQLATDLGVADRIQIAGGIPKSDVSNWLNQGDIFLNTTNVDNTPVSVMEAMACGLCVVSTSVGGISHLLENGHDALLVPANNPEEMAAAVRRLLSEPLLSQQLSKNGRKKVDAFDWSVLLPQWEELFATLVKFQR